MSNERHKVPPLKMQPIESAEESASAREPLVGGVPRASGNLDVSEVALSSRPTGKREFQPFRFYLSLEKIPYPECNCRLILIEVLRATRERVREFIGDMELASSHQLEQMQRVRMLKKQAA